MWLINTENLRLEYFQTCPIKQYAILSHRWRDHEVTHQDFQDTRRCVNKKGYRKIIECCKQARHDRLEYAWVDTCCIDKTSSAELSEAINSMFGWYANAKVCYAYLDDFLSGERNGLHEAESANVASHDGNTPSHMMRRKGRFEDSLWFTRGWTLQELLAPRRVLFFDANWQFFGNRKDLSTSIKDATGIYLDALTGKESIYSYSVAERMSWAAKRVTTRTEDIAYCLLGIFDINMPLMYGESEKAFIRLQRAIIESNDDETIFAWTGVDEAGSGLLAKHPMDFVDAKHITKKPLDDEDDRILHLTRPPYSMTNKGLQIEMRLIPVGGDRYMVPLAASVSCEIFSEKRSGPTLAIFLCRTQIDGQYRRVKNRGVDLFRLYTGQNRNTAKNNICESCKILQIRFPEQALGRSKLLYVPQHQVELVSRCDDTTITVKNNPATFSIDGVTLGSGARYAFSSTLYDEWVTKDTTWLSWKTTIHLPHNSFTDLPKISLPLLGLGIDRVRIGFDDDYAPVCMIGFSDSATAAGLPDSLWHTLWNDFAQTSANTRGNTLALGSDHKNVEVLKGHYVDGFTTVFQPSHGTARGLEVSVIFKRIWNWQSTDRVPRQWQQNRWCTGWYFGLEEIPNGAWLASIGCEQFEDSFNRRLNDLANCPTPSRLLKIPKPNDESSSLVTSQAYVNFVNEQLSHCHDQQTQTEDIFEDLSDVDVRSDVAVDENRVPSPSHSSQGFTPSD